MEDIKQAVCEQVERERIYPYKADASTAATLDNLRELIGADKVEAVLKPITDLINTSVEEGSFSCIITNSMIEELFSLDSNSFDDTILQFVVNMLKMLRYKVSDNELVYGDATNYIEISWYAHG